MENRTQEQERALTSGFLATCLVWGQGLLIIGLAIAWIAHFLK